MTRIADRLPNWYGLGGDGRVCLGCRATARTVEAVEHAPGCPAIGAPSHSVRAIAGDEAGGGSG